MLFRVIRAVLILLLLVIICGIIFFPSLSRLKELADFEKRIDKKIARLDKEIGILKIEEELAEKDPAYKEYLLRKKLGLIKKDEYILKIEKR